MDKFFDKEVGKKIIFVDCFNTVILRNKSKNEIFKSWAKEVGERLNIPWITFYKTYKKVNFWLCFKKIFTKFILQEKMSCVLEKMYNKLLKKHKILDKNEFLTVSNDVYIKKEMEAHEVCDEFIAFLRKTKKSGAKIFIVSDFYLANFEIEMWVKNLKVDDIFTKIFSSCDYDKEKSTIRLYKFLLKELTLDKRDVLMIGDNLWSDVLMAKLCGICAKRINFKKRKKNEEKGQGNN